ncbi:hypothetical protein EYF80_031686 [Liparis tanakae]|uniref:Uncharacterized protein n=1 Tax=Liparis tanakae TaxID=230148 RepID=A0A4Z2GWQ9_9TELE|nr:hypothetical protein EYF80_031686 [Liparis tanakae]
MRAPHVILILSPGAHSNLSISSMHGVYPCGSLMGPCAAPSASTTRLVSSLEICRASARCMSVMVQKDATRWSGDRTGNLFLSRLETEVGKNTRHNGSLESLSARQQGSQLYTALFWAGQAAVTTAFKLPHSLRITKGFRAEVHGAKRIPTRHLPQHLRSR